MADTRNNNAYEQALDFLNEHRDVERTSPEDREEASFDLAGIRRALDRLDHPEDLDIPVHIGGTKGKGSVCLMLEAFLRGAGLSTGTFLSPHLRTIRERIRIDRRPVTEEQFAAGLDPVRRSLSEADDAGDASPPDLTYFEWLTLIAFVLFQRESVGATVLEVGLGGRLDATNVVSPDLTVITALGLDHQAFLGETIEEIAREKAGILTSGVPLVTTARPDRGLEVVLDRAGSAGAPAYVLERDFHVEDRTPQRGSSTGQRVAIRLSNEERVDVYLPVPGRHQAENLAAALQGFSLLVEKHELPWNRGILNSAARQLSLPGRFQTVHRDPPVIVDAAHNPLACRALVDALDELHLASPRTLLFGSARDKDWKEMLRILAPAFDRLLLTGYSHDRAENPEAMAEGLKRDGPEIDHAVCTSPESAVRTHLEDPGQARPLIAVGSFYLAGEVQAALENRTEA